MSFYRQICRVKWFLQRNKTAPRRTRVVINSVVPFVNQSIKLTTSRYSFSLHMRYYSHRGTNCQNCEINATEMSKWDVDQGIRIFFTLNELNQSNERNWEMGGRICRVRSDLFLFPLFVVVVGVGVLSWKLHQFSEAYNDWRQFANYGYLSLGSLYPIN